jgi:hypothetical protein
LRSCQRLPCAIASAIPFSRRGRTPGVCTNSVCRCCARGTSADRQTCPPRSVGSRGRCRRYGRVQSFVRGPDCGRSRRRSHSMTIFEHCRTVIFGACSRLALPIFPFPKAGVLGNTDAYARFGLPYTIARMIFDEFVPYELALATPVCGRLCLNGALVAQRLSSVASGCDPRLDPVHGIRQHCSPVEYLRYVNASEPVCGDTDLMKL